MTMAEIWIEISAPPVPLANPAFLRPWLCYGTIEIILLL